MFRPETAPSRPRASAARRLHRMSVSSRRDGFTQRPLSRGWHAWAVTAVPALAPRGERPGRRAGDHADDGSRLQGRQRLDTLRERLVLRAVDRGDSPRRCARNGRRTMPQCCTKNTSERNASHARAARGGHINGTNVGRASQASRPMDPAPATTASAIIKWSAIFALAFTPLLSAAARSDGDSSTTEDLRIRPRPERGRRVGAAP